MMAKRISSYMNRALKSRDPRYKKILNKLGYDTRELKAKQPSEEVAVEESAKEVIVEETSPEDSLKNARSQYEQTFGKKPYYGWNVEQLLEKIAKANEE